MSELTVVRPPHIAEDIVFVDGLPGCGKTMMSPIVGALDRVEMIQYAYPIEYICALGYLDKIAPDAATSMIRMLSDLQLYNIMMARETNFRWSDLSSVRLSAAPWKYLRRLFMKGDQAAVERIRAERPILHLVTHLLFANSPMVYRALGERAKFVVVVRHPLYMIRQQSLYMDRWAADARDFSIWFEAPSGDTVPWFARGWEEKFLRANAMDRAIYMIEEMGKVHARVLAGMTTVERDRTLFVPFERFVVEPESYMRRLEAVLGTRVTDTTRREMKRQNVPRKMYAEGIGRAIYREYGWQPPTRGSEADEFAARRAFAAQTATPAAMEVLDRLSAEYEAERLEPSTGDFEL